MRLTLLLLCVGTASAVAPGELIVHVNTGELDSWEVDSFQPDHSYYSFLDITETAAENATNFVNSFNPPFEHHADTPWAISTVYSASSDSNEYSRNDWFKGSGETTGANGFVRFVVEDVDRVLPSSGNTARFALAMNSGDVVDASSGSYRTTAATHLEFTDSDLLNESTAHTSPFYTGVSFRMNSLTHYGWVLWDPNDSFGLPLAWAYETEANVGATIVPIPAPGGAALLGFGALAAARRRRA